MKKDWSEVLLWSGLGSTCWWGWRPIHLGHHAVQRFCLKIIKSLKKSKKSLFKAWINNTLDHRCTCLSVSKQYFSYMGKLILSISSFSSLFSTNCIPMSYFMRIKVAWQSLQIKNTFFKFNILIFSFFIEYYKVHIQKNSSIRVNLINTKYVLRKP